MIRSQAAENDEPAQQKNPMPHKHGLDCAPFVLLWTRNAQIRSSKFSLAGCWSRNRGESVSRSS